MTSRRVALVFAVALASVALWPAEARAQHVGVFVGGGDYRAPVYGPFTYGPYWPAFGQWYPYPYPYPPAYYRRGDTAEARLEISPRNAQVYLDGYYMGVVNNFDGTFQRLEVPSGDHELVVYLKGYRSYRQRTFFRPGRDYRFKAILEPLGEGEQPEPPPQPPADVPRTGPPNEPGYYPPHAPAGPPERPRPPEPATEAEGFGTLSMRVQPADAVVAIDGQRWDAPESGSRLIVQLASGRHRVEVEKAGYTPYATTIEVRAGETQTLNVSLPPGGGA